MKAVIFGLVFAWGAFASAATTCVAMESTDGENFDQVIAQKQITQDGQPTIVLQREQDVYAAIDNGKVISIGQLMVDANGESQVTLMASGNGTQVLMLSVPANLAIVCARQ
ncbi:MAG TPA: hypothetical protein PL182_00975 [Pseudobdellovibrionaceae bacterium]|nr:hypothetical protein [Pseudobdellovibrionaceae bacterium]